MSLYLKTKDYFNTQQEFDLLYDKEYDMLSTHPIPDNLDIYYNSEEYVSHSDQKKTIIDKIYQIVKIYSLNKKVDLLNIYKKESNKLLDIGAGTGDFLLSAQSKGWEITGIEPNELARKNAALKGINLQSDISKIDKTYDAITLWHVLEHLPNLHQQIKKIISLLDNNGTLIIAVPNYKSYDAKKYGPYWAAYDVPRHLHHFSKTSISKIFEKHNMSVIDIKPMIFDSFYVSLLSEKYKHNSSKYFNAFITGFTSNIKAKHSGEYSSLIYVLKRIKN